MFGVTGIPNDEAEPPVPSRQDTVVQSVPHPLSVNIANSGSDKSALVKSISKDVVVAPVVIEYQTVSFDKSKH